jgi:hypothetical protein
MSSNCAVPTSHVLRALAVDQFYCAGGAAAGCPQITTVGAEGTVSIDRYQYVSNYVGTTYQHRGEEIGWAVLAVAVMLIIGILALRFINHQKR